MLKNVIAMSLSLAIIIGHGIVNPNHQGIQAKMMAKKAACCDIYRQTGGQSFKIIKETFDGVNFIIEAEVN